MLQSEKRATRRNALLNMSISDKDELSSPEEKNTSHFKEKIRKMHRHQISEMNLLIDNFLLSSNINPDMATTEMIAFDI